MIDNIIKKLLLLPSTYGFLTYTVFGFMYIVGAFQYENIALETIGVILITSFFLGLGSYLFLYLFQLEEVKMDVSSLSISSFTLICFFLIGAYGIFKYVLDFSDFLGGYVLFFAYIIEGESMGIREAAQYTESFGTQLTYFGWIFFAIVVVHPSYRKSLSPLLLLIFVGNLLYIDRTRPIWILFPTLLLMMIYNLNAITFKRVMLSVLLIPTILISIFNFIGDLIGKVSVEGRYGESFIPFALQNAFFYLTSGYAYLNRLILMESNVSYIPERILYPMFKLGSMVGILKEPPSQVIEFFYIPFPTNVGTFLEPYFQDGGYLYVFLGVIIHSLGLNFLSLFLLRSRRIIPVFVWANLCFVNLMANFTPKISSFPIWLFCLIALFDIFFSRIHISK